MKLAFIAALGRNRVIGRNGKLPWHLPEDLKRFKRLTTGHTVLMGRKSFESLGKPLPNRRNVVLSSKPIPGVQTFSSIKAALKELQNDERVFVIGGGEIFKALLEKADEMFLTFVDGDFEGDTFFPPFEHLVGKMWKITQEEKHKGFRFVDYVRM
ncbi:MAG: dihydrofolate reductase [Bacteroidota bacterium]